MTQPQVYDNLRRQAADLGHMTVSDALDRLALHQFVHRMLFVVLPIIAGVIAAIYGVARLVG
jgi:hypothetical protein